MPALMPGLVPRRCRIFVSYAHQDALPPKDQPLAHSLLSRFEVELKNLRLTLASRGHQLHEDEIFIDRQRLKSAAQWSPAIQRAVADCELMVLLVSPDSKASDFCRDHELGPVVQRGKVPIVPVLLRDTSGWTELALGAGRLLGKEHSGGLPKNQMGNAMAITNPDWGQADIAWARMTDDLTDFVGSQLFGGGSFGGTLHRGAALAAQPAQAASGAAAPAPTAPPMGPQRVPVTYFCDQLHVTDTFDDSVALRLQPSPEAPPAAPPHALLAIVQGHFHDHPAKLVDRLLQHHLVDKLRRMGLSVEAHHQPMYWPDPLPPGDARLWRAALRPLFQAVDNQLPAQLALCSQPADAVRVLQAHMARPATPVRIVYAHLPDRRPQTVAALKAMMACIDACNPGQGEMAKLALFCVDEKPGAKAAWASLLPPVQRMLALALQPMKPFNEMELRQWHVQHQLEGQLPWLDCLALFHRTIAEQPLLERSRRAELRLGLWAAAVRRHHAHVDAICPSAAGAVASTATTATTAIPLP